MNDDKTTVQHLRNLMQEFVVERDWTKFHTPKNLAGSVAIEASELLELFQWLTTEDATERAKGDQEFRTKIGDEMADVLLYLLSLANALNIDVSTATINKIEKNKIKYPVKTAGQFGRY